MERIPPPELPAAAAVATGEADGIDRAKLERILWLQTEAERSRVRAEEEAFTSSTQKKTRKPRLKGGGGGKAVKASEHDAGAGTAAAAAAADAGRAVGGGGDAAEGGAAAPAAAVVSGARTIAKKLACITSQGAQGAPRPEVTLVACQHWRMSPGRDAPPGRNPPDSAGRKNSSSRRRRSSSSSNLSSHAAVGLGMRLSANNVVTYLSPSGRGGERWGACG